MSDHTTTATVRPGGQPLGRMAWPGRRWLALATLLLGSVPAVAQAPSGLHWERLPVFQQRQNQNINALDWLIGDGTAGPALDTLLIFSTYGPFFYQPERSDNGEWHPWHQITNIPAFDGLVTDEGSFLFVSPVFRSGDSGRTMQQTFTNGSPPLFEVTLPWMREVSNGRSVLLVGFDADDHAISYADGEEGSWRRTGRVTVFPESLAEVPPSPALPRGRLLSGSALTMYSDDGSETWQVAALGDQPNENYIWFRFAFMEKVGHPYGGIVFATGCELLDCDGGPEVVDVYRSDDGGASWTRIYEFTAAETSLPFIDGVALQLGYPIVGPDGALWTGVSRAQGIRNPGRIMRSTDEGVTWHRADAGLAQDNSGRGWRIRQLKAARDGRLYAATDFGVWRTTEPVATAAQANPPRPEAPAITASPNPSSGSVTLSVTASESARYALVDVFTLEGRSLEIVHANALAVGQHTFAVDVSGWAAGTYVARVWTEGVQQSTRFTVAR